MKKNLKRIGYLLLVPLVALVIVFLPVFESKAATLDTAYIMLSRMQANLTGTADIDIFVALEPVTSFSGGATLTLEFPDADDAGWCRVAGADLVVAGVTETPADSTGDYDIDAALPGTLVGTCSQGSGASSVDTITITGLTALTAGNTYGVKISNGASTAELGTASGAGSHIVSLTVTEGTDVDTASFGLNLVTDDQVDISATVVDVQTVTCSLSTNSVDLGNLYKGGSYVTGTHTITTATSSSAAGYYWAVYGTGDGSTNAGLYKSTATTYLIESDDSGSTVDISAPGSEGFGMNTTTPSGTVGGTGFAGNSAGVFGSVGLGQDNAELLLYQVGAQASSEKCYNYLRCKSRCKC